MVQDECPDAEESSTNIQEWGQVDEQLGEYLSPIEVVITMGGWKHKESIRRGVNVCNTCARLGGRFVQWNCQSKGWDVLLLKNMH